LFPDQAVKVGPWSGTLVVFLGKTLYSHHSGVQMGTRKFNTGEAL